MQVATAGSGEQWAGLARKAEDLGLLDAVHARPLRRPAGPDPRAHGRGRRHHRAEGRRPGVRQRLQAPRRAGQGGRHHRRAVGRPRRAGPGGRLDEHRLRAVGHPPRPGRRAHRPDGRGPRRHEGAVRGRRVRLPGRALHDHRPRRPARSPPPGPTPRSSSAEAASGCWASPAREADIVASTPTLRTGAVDATAAADATAEATDRKLGWLREAAGDRFDDLELNALLFACMVTDDRQGSAEMMAGAVRHLPRRGARGPPRAHRLGRRDRARPSRPAASGGASPTSWCSRTRSTPSPR